MENPLAIANYFIKKGLDEGVEITPMKLIKLVYVAHGWNLGLTGEPLLAEGVEAWQYGPVIPKVYNEFRKFGNISINSTAYDTVSQNYPLPAAQPLKDFLNKIWEVYGHYSGKQLSTLTHQANTPWDIVWNQQGGRDRKGTLIPNELIHDHYKNKASETQPANADNIA